MPQPCLQRLEAFAGCDPSLRSCLRTGRLWHSDKLIKKRSVMNHCLAQFFRTGLATRLTNCDFVGCTVIFQNRRIVHGDVRRTLFKVAYRIATVGHHIAQQLVGIRYGTSGAVNEPRLHPAPGLDEASTITRTERPDVETLHSICALIEPRFRMSPAPTFLQGAVIFSATKPSAQFCTAAPSKRAQCSDDRKGNHNHATNDD